MACFRNGDTDSVRFSTTWTSPTESNGGLGLSIGPSYTEIWNFVMAGFRNGDTDSVGFSTTWTSPTESNGGLGLSIGPSYAEIWNFVMACFRNGDTDSVGFPPLDSVGLVQVVENPTES